MKPMSEFITWAHQRRPLLRIMPLPLASNLVLAVVGAAVAGWCFVRNFWTLGDLYLLGRVADQMWAGHGLVWNQGEPVQVYTSAAWMLVIAATRPLIDDLYVQALVLHALLLAGLLGVLYWHFRSGALLAAAVLAFTASWGFFDYTAGGLENGLAFLMVAIFAVGLFRKWELCHLAAVAGLTLLVRHDLLLLVGPAPGLGRLGNSRRPECPPRSGRWYVAPRPGHALDCVRVALLRGPPPGCGNAQAGLLRRHGSRKVGNRRHLLVGQPDDRSPQHCSHGGSGQFRPLHAGPRGGGTDGGGGPVRPLRP